MTSSVTVHLGGLRYLALHYDISRIVVPSHLLRATIHFVFSAFLFHFPIPISQSSALSNDKKNKNESVNFEESH